MNSMVNITYVQTEFAESITNLEYSQIDLRFGNELQLLRSLSGRVLSNKTGAQSGGHSERSIKI